MKIYFYCYEMVQGRQGGDYWKYTLFQKKWKGFGWDCYLLKFGPDYQMPEHRDPVPGWNHWRLNLVFKGKGKFEVEKTILNLWNRIILFRPDLYTHSVKNGPTVRKVLSIGWAIKKKDEEAIIPSNIDHNYRM